MLFPSPLDRVSKSNSVDDLSRILFHPVFFPYQLRYGGGEGGFLVPPPPPPTTNDV